MKDKIGKEECVAQQSKDTVPINVDLLEDKLLALNIEHHIVVDIVKEVTQQSKVVSDEDLHVILKSLAEQRATPSFQDGFHQGAKWMREQLTKKD